LNANNAGQTSLFTTYITNNGNNISDYHGLGTKFSGAHCGNNYTTVGDARLSTSINGGY
jgi:hypothetical protein